MIKENNNYEKFVSLFLFTKISLKSRNITKENGGNCKLLTRTLETFERFAGRKIFSLYIFFSFLYVLFFHIFLRCAPPLLLTVSFSLREDRLFSYINTCVFMIFFLQNAITTATITRNVFYLQCLFLLLDYFFCDLLFVFKWLYRCCCRTQMGKQL